MRTGSNKAKNLQWTWASLTKHITAKSCYLNAFLLYVEFLYSPNSLWVWVLQCWIWILSLISKFFSDSAFAHPNKHHKPHNGFHMFSHVHMLSTKIWPNIERWTPGYKCTVQPHHTVLIKYVIKQIQTEIHSKAMSHQRHRRSPRESSLLPPCDFLFDMWSVYFKHCSPFHAKL